MSYSYEFYKKTCGLLKSSGFNPKRILDIGASMGFTANIVKECWPDSELLLFEGNEDCKQYLQNYNCIYKLLGKANGTTSFYKSKKDKYGTGNSIYKEMSDEYNNDNLIVETKSIYRLDDCVTGVYDLIKIDTQGSELDIIEGGLNTISAAKVLIVEVTLVNNNVGGCSKNDILNKLSELKFDLVDTIEFIHNKGIILQENLLFIKPTYYL